MLVNRVLSAFFLINVLHFGKVFNILFERLEICISLLDIIPILLSRFLKIFDLVVQLEQSSQFGNFGDLVPNLLRLLFLLQIDFFLVGFARH